jgi:drug/metabolite transporter (DMT)-like permease
MESSLIGETAAVATSCLWTIGSIFFTSAGRKIGSLSLNAYRSLIAVGFLLAAHLFFLESFLPHATYAQWFWMGLSGVVGLGIGDSGLFAAYVLMGPRRSVLVMALSPIFATVGAYLMLGEILPSLALIGIAITLGGIMLVLLEGEKHSGELPLSRKLKTYGVFFAFIGAVGQGVGLVLAKVGIYSNSAMTLNPLSATLMRMILGAFSVFMVMLVGGRVYELRRALSNRKGMGLTVVAAFTGPFLGATFSMIAVTYAQAGVAQTLMSLSPVMIIPLVWFLYNQRTSWRGIIGALIAVLGVSILFLV